MQLKKRVGHRLDAASAYIGVDGMHLLRSYPAETALLPHATILDAGQMGGSYSGALVRYLTD